MKAIVLAIASILLLSNISFGQHIDWGPQSSSYVTYSDNTKLIFASGDGVISGEYELLSDGKTLTYEVTINPHVSGDIYEVYVSGFLEGGVPNPILWDYFYQPYTFGNQTFSGSVYLDYTEPTDFMTSVGYLNSDPNWMCQSFVTGSIYYPE